MLINQELTCLQALFFTIYPLIFDSGRLWQGGRSGTEACILGEEYHRLGCFIQKRHAVLHSHQSPTP